MDGIVGPVGATYEVIRIENIHIAMDNVFGHHRIHMMDDNTIMNIVSLDSEVASVISDDNVVTNIAPLS